MAAVTRGPEGRRATRGRGSGACVPAICGAARWSALRGGPPPDSRSAVLSHPEPPGTRPGDLLLNYTEEEDLWPVAVDI